MTKSELRKRYLEMRRSLGDEKHAAGSKAIAKNVFDYFDLSSASDLHCFIPIKKFNEVDTGLIFHRLWDEFPDIRTVVPRVNRETGEIESIGYTANDRLVYGDWQIGEPTHDDLVKPGEIDIVLVPLLCFDLRGHRVGYGKGFYDRFLARCRPDCLKVGLSFFPPVDEISDAHEGDVRLDFCVTTERVYAMQESNADQAD